MYANIRFSTSGSRVCGLLALAALFKAKLNNNINRTRQPLNLTFKFLRASMNFRWRLPV